MSSVSRTLVLRVTLAHPFCVSPLCVCRHLEDQTGSSCFTSSAASSQSQNTTNCFNNNAMRGLASQSDAVEIRGGGIPHHSFSAQGLFTGKWEGRCQLQFTRKEHQGGLPPKEKTGIARRRKSNYVVRSRWRYTYRRDGGGNVRQGQRGVEREQENKQTSKVGSCAFVQETTIAFAGSHSINTHTCYCAYSGGVAEEWGHPQPRQRPQLLHHGRPQPHHQEGADGRHGQLHVRGQKHRRPPQKHLRRRDCVR